MLPTPMTITVGELRVVHHTIERMAGRMFLGAIDENYGFDLSATEHWIMVAIHGRTFGFWRATMKLYEQDEDGAMGEEEVSV